MSRYQQLLNHISKSQQSFDQNVNKWSNLSSIKKHNTEEKAKLILYKLYVYWFLSRYRRQLIEHTMLPIQRYAICFLRIITNDIRANTSDGWYQTLKDMDGH